MGPKKGKKPICTYSSDLYKQNDLEQPLKTSGENNKGNDKWLYRDLV